MTNKPENPPASDKTLRDEFAMAALQGLCANETFFSGSHDSKIIRELRPEEVIVGTALILADELLKMRQS